MKLSKKKITLLRIGALQYFPFLNVATNFYWLWNQEVTGFAMLSHRKSLYTRISSPCPFPKMSILLEAEKRRCQYARCQMAIPL